MDSTELAQFIDRLNQVSLLAVYDVRAFLLLENVFNLVHKTIKSHEPDAERSEIIMMMLEDVVSQVESLYN